MNFLNRFFEQLIVHPFFVLPAFALCITIIVYLFLPAMFGKVKTKLLFQREEVMRLMQLMFVKTDQKRLTIMMLLLSFGLGTVMFLILWPHVILALPVGALVTYLMWGVPLTYVKRQYENRCNLMVNQMVDAMTIMANGIKAGASITKVMQNVERSLPNPISQEFGLVLDQINKNNVPIEEALVELSVRIPRPDIQMFVTAVNILRESGGNMGETFTTIASTIRERQKIEKEIEAKTAQGIMQGLIISIVPPGILAFLWIADPAFINPMFTTTLGLFLLIIMFSLVVAGGIMIKKIVTIKV